MISVICSTAVHTLQGQGLLSPAEKPSDYNSFIISDYHEGFKLQTHIDLNEAMAMQRNTGYCFDDPIIGIVMIADEQGKLYTTADKKTPLTQSEFLPEKDGTVFVLSGCTRDVWHGVSEVKNRRLSLTCRKVMKAGASILG